jgi:hypothetical protein
VGLRGLHAHGCAGVGCVAVGCAGVGCEGVGCAHLICDADDARRASGGVSDRGRLAATAHEISHQRGRHAEEALVGGIGEADEEREEQEGNDALPEEMIGQQRR